MGSNPKLKVAVLYGGRSGEHDVSLISAASVIRNLDPKRFEIVPILIDLQGRWHLNDLSKLMSGQSRSLPVFKDAPQVLLPPAPGNQGAELVAVTSPARGVQGVDVVFPVMHGTFCEDGSIQGLLELADVPYVGCGVLASAVGMDKDVAKKLARDAGIPVVPWVCLRKDTWGRDARPWKSKIQSELGYPVFVKPSNAGSSIGVHRVRETSELDAAVNDAFRYDVKVLVEKAVAAREIELSVLESLDAGAPPRVSVPGEVTPTGHEFYSYESKYIDDKGAALSIPAKLTAEQTREAQRMAGAVFTALECEGMARVDLFLDKTSGQFMLNEINTIPGFTHISMYPKMWEASGLPYGELLTALIELAVARHRRKSGLVREFHQSE